MIQKIYLIRHGQTDFSKLRKYCGVTDVGLNSLGVSQAQEVAQVLGGESIQAVYTSPLQRAEQFSRLVSPKREPRIITGLAEIDFGRFEGMTHDELMRTYPTVYPAWLENPFVMKIPQGEVFDDFVQRVKDAWSMIRSDQCTTVAIVSHGGPLRIIVGEVLGLSLKEALRLPFDEASVSTFERAEDTWKTLGMNETQNKGSVMFRPARPHECSGAGGDVP